ncbi:MAG: hypothetical protein K2X93_02450 [Candidatus Obscuribacterales bacterium]|nr:hypothetical protein [Candidatus Obscuribacterales bacterium]
MFTTFDVSKVKAELKLQAHGIDSKQSYCADLLSAPRSYYTTTATFYNEASRQLVFRVNFDDKTSTTIYNDPDTDPRLKAALAHRIIMDKTGIFADEMERKAFAFFNNAIVRGDLELLTQVICALFVADPERGECFADTTSALLMDSGAGIRLTKSGINQVLLHAYHGNCAVAIDTERLSASVVPITTEWDGTVNVIDAEVLSPTSEDLLERLREQCVVRVLLKHEIDGDESNTLEVPAVYGQAA